MKPLIIIGNGGHRKVVTDVALENEFYIAGILDDSFTDVLQKDGCYFGPVSEFRSIMEKTEAQLFFGIGNNNVRDLIVNKFNMKNEDFPVLISKHAMISPTAKIGSGTLVMPGAIINAEAEIGQHVIINTASVVEHDCIIGDYAHISPNATLTGAVHVGALTQIGAQAVVNPGVSIGINSIIGSGSVVIRNVDDHIIAAGVPAKTVRMKE